MRYRLLVVIMLVLSVLRTSAQYQVTEKCNEAWLAIMDLRFDAADSLIAEELVENPTNYYATYLIQTNDAFRFMIDMSEEGYEEICNKYEIRMDYLQGKDDESPYYNACIAEMQLQVGMFNIIYGEKLTGLRKAYGSYKKTYRNIDKYPDFNQSYKLDGIFNVAISNMPPFVGWAVSFFGVSGDYLKGYEIMRKYFEETDSMSGLKLEAVLYNILAFKLNKDPETAYDFFTEIPQEYKDYKLLRYFMGNVAYRTGNNKEAVSIIGGMKTQENGFYFNGINYMMGKILLRKLDTNCRSYLKLFLGNQKQEQYHKEINYELALSYIIEGDFDGFELYKYKSEEYGNEITERDREAVCDYNKKYVPNVKLTRAGLLLNGGYYSEAEIELEEYESESESGSGSGSGGMPYELEYLFLKGKLEYEKGVDSLATYYFAKVIEMGKKESYSFAAHAALYMAYINENNNTDQALKYYKLAKDLWKSGFYDYIYEIAVKKVDILEGR